MTLAHWDEVEAHRRTKGEIDATVQRLGAAAGAQEVGVNRVRVAPGKLPTPPHSHGASEELYYVLGGSGLAWQDEAVHEVRPGDCVVHVADAMEHTFRAGPEGLELLVFGTNHPTEYGWLPRSRAVRLGWPWVEGRTDDPWDVEAAAGPLAFGDPAERPANIVNIEEVEVLEDNGVLTRPLASNAGSVQTGLHWERLEPGRKGSVPHVHSTEEEAFAILDGDGWLELWPTPVTESRGIAREDLPLRRGHLVARPPGSKIAHAFRAGPSGLTMLIYGTRRPDDVAYYPRSRKIYWRGLGVIARVEPLDYMDGEPPD